MNCQKTTVFRYLSGFAVLAFAVNLFTTNSFAQAERLSLSNLVAVSSESNEAALKRPRIVGAVKIGNAASESNNASNSAALISRLERQAFDVLNRKRVENGLLPLVWSEDMAKVARAHSQEMAQFRFFSHAGRNGSMVNDRADTLGYRKWKAIGENIAYNRGYENPAEFACERWMQSVSHRENILNSRWREAGIGVAITADGTHYFTEVFISPR